MLAFYPGDNTPGCTRQMCSYRDDLAKFKETGAVLLGISPQDVDSHEKWAEKKGFSFPLLADIDKKVIEAYGVGGSSSACGARCSSSIPRAGCVRRPQAHRRDLRAGRQARPGLELDQLSPLR